MSDKFPYPESIRLSRTSDHGIHGKVVTYYNIKTNSWHGEKGPKDHEDFARKADASLLHHMLDDFMELVKGRVEKKEFASSQAQAALEMMHSCWRALGPARDSSKLFIGLEPYSDKIINQAAIALKTCLEVLNVFQLAKCPTLVKVLYKQLFALAEEAEQRYEVIEFANG